MKIIQLRVNKVNDFKVKKSKNKRTVVIYTIFSPNVFPYLTSIMGEIKPFRTPLYSELFLAFG